MKKLLQSSLVRVTCQILVLAMLATLIPGGLTTKAYAQSGSALGSEKARNVGVIEFINDSSRFGQIVSKNATSAFVMECEKNDKVFKVESSPEDMKAKMDELGIRLPASKDDCVALATELGLDGVIQGYIKSVSVSGKGKNVSANATVTVQYVDRASGEILMGTNAKGTSSPRIGFTADEDTLIIEAISKAVSLAFYNLSYYNVPKATIHSNEGEDKVVLNVGRRSNLYPGLRMVVMRGAYPQQDSNLEDSTIVTEMRVVGYIEIMEVGSMDAVGKIIKQNVGVKPEDICYGLYNDVYVSKYSTYDETSNNVTSKRAQDNAKRNSAAEKIGMVVLGLAAVVGLASLFNKKGSGGASGPNIESGENGTIIIRENGDTSISGKIVGVRVFQDNKHIDLFNNPEDHTVTTGPYDGQDDVEINVWGEGLWPETAEGKQYTYKACWLYYDTGKENPIQESSKKSGSTKMTRMAQVSGLVPSDDVITANNFVEKEIFIWNKQTYAEFNTAYRVEIWNVNDVNDKRIITPASATSGLGTYLNKEELTSLYETYFKKGKVDVYSGKSYAWRVGVRNPNDTKVFWTWSDPQAFTVESLPEVPPSDGKRRNLR